MTSIALERLFEHNNWANSQIFQACAALDDEHLDAIPRGAGNWSLRDTLMHLVAAQQGYLALLTLPVDARLQAAPEFTELGQAASRSGEALRSLARDDAGSGRKEPLRTMDGYLVEPWVVLLQVINHATVHREQIRGLLKALGVTPPGLDGWAYGAATNALTPVSPPPEA